MINLKIVVIGLLSVLSTSVSALRCQQSSESAQLLCYFKGKATLKNINLSNCTHLVFKNAVKKDATDIKLHVNEDIQESLALVKETNSDLQTIFTLKLKLNESAVILESESKRKHLIKEILAILQETQFDGVELNFKFTQQSNGSKDSYSSFIKALSKSLDFLHRRRKRKSYDVFEMQDDDVTTAAYTTLIPKSGKTKATTEKTPETENQRKSRGYETKNVGSDEADWELTTTEGEEPTTYENSHEDDPITEVTTTEFESSESTEGAEDIKEIEESEESEESEECENKFWLIVRLPVHLDVIGKKFDLKVLSRYADILSVPTHKIINENEKNQIYHPSRLMGLSDVYNTDSVLDFLLGMGAVKSKIVVSVPASVVKFQLKNVEKNTPGSFFIGYPEFITQSELCRLFKERNWTLERDEDLTAPYAYSGDTWLAFEDEISVNIKAKYILLRELAGGAVYPIDSDINDESCTKRPGTGGYLTGFLRSNFEKLGRKPRAVVLDSLQEDIHNRAYSSIEAGVKISDYRIVRIVDHSGAVHVIRRNTKTQFECSRQGYFVHPLGCNKFYRCVKFDQYSDEFTVFEYDCPTGLAFDERWEVCVWPGSLPNGSPCTGSSEIAPVPRSHYQCPRQEGYYGDPENCRWFFACLDHARDGSTPLTAYEFRCPFGLVFNEEKLACDWPWIVGSCGNRGAGGYLGSSSGVHTSTFVNGGNLEASYGQYGTNAEETGLFGRGFGTVLKGTHGLSSESEQRGSGLTAAAGYILSPFDDSRAGRGSFASYSDYEISGGRSHNNGGVVLHEAVNGAGNNGVFSSQIAGFSKLESPAYKENFSPTPLPSSTPFVVRVPFNQATDTESGSHSLTGFSHQSTADLSNSGNVDTQNFNGGQKYVYKFSENGQSNLETDYSREQQYSTSLGGSDGFYVQGSTNEQQPESQSVVRDGNLNLQAGKVDSTFRVTSASNSNRGTGYFAGVQQVTNDGQFENFNNKHEEYLSKGQAQFHNTRNGNAYLGGGQVEKDHTRVSFNKQTDFLHGVGDSAQRNLYSFNSQPGGQHYSAQSTGRDSDAQSVYLNEKHKIGDLAYSNGIKTTSPTGTASPFAGGYISSERHHTTPSISTTKPTVASVTPVSVTKPAFPVFGSGFGATGVSVTLSPPSTSHYVTPTTPVPPVHSVSDSGFEAISGGISHGQTSVTSSGTTVTHSGSSPTASPSPAILGYQRPSIQSAEFTGNEVPVLNVQNPISSYASNAGSFNGVKNQQSGAFGTVDFGLNKFKFGAEVAGQAEQASGFENTKIQSDNFGLNYGAPKVSPAFGTYESGNQQEIPLAPPGPKTNTVVYQALGPHENVKFTEPIYKIPVTSSESSFGFKGSDGVSFTGSVDEQNSYKFGTTGPSTNVFAQQEGQTQGKTYQGIKYVSSSFTAPGHFDEEKFNSAVSFVQQGTTYNKPGIRTSFVANSYKPQGGPGFEAIGTNPTVQTETVPQVSYSTPSIKSGVHVSSPRPFSFENQTPKPSIQLYNSPALQSEKDTHATDISIEKQPIIEVGTMAPPVYQYQQTSSRVNTANHQGFQNLGFEHINFKSTSHQPKLSTTYSSTPLPAVSVTTATPVTYTQTKTTSNTTPLSVQAKFVTPLPVTTAGLAGGFSSVAHLPVTSDDKHVFTGSFNQASISGAGFDGIVHVSGTGNEKHVSSGTFGSGVGEGSVPVSAFSNALGGDLQVPATSGSFKTDLTSISNPPTGFEGHFGGSVYATTGSDQSSSRFNTKTKQAAGASTGSEGSLNGVTHIPTNLNGKYLSSANFKSDLNAATESNAGYESTISSIPRVTSNEHTSLNGFNNNQVSVSTTGFDGSFGNSATPAVLVGKHSNENRKSNGFSNLFGGVSYHSAVLHAKPVAVSIIGPQTSFGHVAPTPSSPVDSSTVNQVNSFAATGLSSYSSGPFVSTTETYTTAVGEPEKVNVQQIVEVTPKPVTYQESLPITGQKNVIIQTPEEFVKTQAVQHGTNYAVEEITYDVHPPSSSFSEQEQGKTQQYADVSGTKTLYSKENFENSPHTSFRQYFQGPTASSHSVTTPNPPTTKTIQKSAKEFPFGNQNTEYLGHDHQSIYNKHNIDVENAKFFGTGSSLAETTKTTLSPTIVPFVSFSPEVLDVQQEVTSPKFKVHAPDATSDYVASTVSSFSSTQQYNKFDFQPINAGETDGTGQNLYGQNIAPESFGKFYAYDGSQNLTNGRVHSLYGNNVKGTINPNIKIPLPPKEYAFQETYGGEVDSTTSGKFEGDYQSVLGNSGSGYAAGVGNKDDLLGKVSYKMTMSPEEADKIKHRDEMEQLLDKYSSSFGKVINGEIYKTKLANAYARGRTYTGASGVLSQTSTGQENANDGRTREKSRGRQYHGGITSDIPATNKYEEYEIEKESSFEFANGGTGSSRTSQDLRNLKANKFTRPVVVVSQTSEANPILVGKLAGQCSCQSNLLELKNNGRKPGAVRLKIRKYKSRNQDENSVLKPSSTPFNQEYSAGTGNDVSSTIAYDNTPSSIYPTYRSNDAGSVTSKSGNVGLSGTGKKFRGRARFLSQSSSTGFGDSGSDSFLSPVLASQIDGDNDIHGELPKTQAGASFDRYGPGGWRSPDETLQGSIDCKRPGLFRHPKYCNKFYACNWDPWEEKFTLHVFNCPIRLTYDSSISACNWPVGGPACANDNLLV